MPDSLPERMTLDYLRGYAAALAHFKQAAHEYAEVTDFRDYIATADVVSNVIDQTYEDLGGHA